MPDLLDRLKTALADRYAIQEELGAGGMATVYLARDLKHDRQVAVKVLRLELAAVVGAERFLREIKITAQLNHPHILPLLDSGEADEFLYYVMPYVDGESLRDRLSREKQLPIEHAIKYTREVADALHSAHRHGVIHRDIKPENILLQEDHAIVADFGIARAVSAAGGDHLTEAGLAIGTPIYMSPEQAAGGDEVTGRSDVYSLACVLYEMLTGDPPFTGPTIESVVRQHLTTDPKLVTDLRTTVPVTLAMALQKALAKTPADRFTTARGFAEALTHEDAAGSHEPAAASIAVLPFTNMSADPENEFFTEGITEDIINALTKIPELRVASRTSAFAFKGQGQDVRAIGERLMVSKVLEGSVRKAANRLRITAQLINTADGYHLWSEQYDRELDDVFAIQDEISHAIVNALKIKLRSGNVALAKRQTHDLDAYNMYVKGRYFWNRRGAGLVKAEKYFTEATNRDPKYAQAHAAVADTYNLLGWYQLRPPKEAFPRAKAAALKALDIDETIAEAHTSLAFAYMYHDWAWAEAEHEFKRAIQLHPGYATTHHWYAEYLMAMGRTGDAIEQAERAQELDPVGLIINVVVGMANYYGRRYDQAIEACQRTVEMDPAFGPAYIWLASAFLQKGLYDDAISASEMEESLAPDHPLTKRICGVAYVLSGRRGKAEQILSELETRAEKMYVSAFDLAVLHFGLGNTDLGFDWLQRAYHERAVWLAFLKVDPMLDAVRDDGRFRKLLTQMALA